MSSQVNECISCGVQAHYRFKYTLDKNEEGVPTCRACHWREWAGSSRDLKGPWADLEPVPFDKAKAYVEDHGFDYLGPLTSTSLSGDPHLTRCRCCTKISAERLVDIGFGCTCRPRN